MLPCATRSKRTGARGPVATGANHGLCDDPREMTNLIGDPDLAEVQASLRHRLFELLENQDGEHVVPYTEKLDTGAVLRHGRRSKAAEFPEAWLRQR